MSPAAAFPAVAPAQSTTASAAVAAAKAHAQTFGQALDSALAIQGTKAGTQPGALTGAQALGVQAAGAQAASPTTSTSILTSAGSAAAAPTLGQGATTTQQSLAKQLAAAKAQAKAQVQGQVQVQGQTATQTAAALAGAQAVAAPAAISTSTTVSLNDLLTQAAAVGSSTTPGADQARLATFTQKLNKIETQATGVDPSAPPQGWSEPDVFAQARALLNKTLGGGTTTASAPVTVSKTNPLATAGLPVAGAAPSPQTTQSQLQSLTAQTGANGQASAAAQAIVTPAAGTHPLQAADAGQTAPFAAAVQSQDPGAKAAASNLHSLTAAGDTQPVTGASTILAQAVQSPAGAHEKPADHGDDLGSGDADATADVAAATPDAVKSADADTGADAAIAANNIQAQTQTQATAAVAQAAVNDPSHAMPQATAYLAAQMVKGVNGKSSQFDIELHPADLGRVDVQMRIEQDGRLNATLAFDNPAAAAEFRAHSGELRQQLQQAGFQVSDDSLNFTDRNSQGFAQQQASQGFDQNANSNSSSDQSGSRARAFQDSNVTAQVADASMTSSRGAVVSGLDIKV